MLQLLFLDDKPSGRSTALNQQTIDVIRMLNRRPRVKLEISILQQGSGVPGCFQQAHGSIGVVRSQQEPFPAIVL